METVALEPSYAHSKALDALVLEFPNKSLIASFSTWTVIVFVPDGYNCAVKVILPLLSKSPSPIVLLKKPLETSTFWNIKPSISFDAVNVKFKYASLEVSLLDISLFDRSVAVISMVGGVIS